jgi:hypothetical protein
MNGQGPDGRLAAKREQDKYKAIVYLQVVCKECGWRGQTATFAINKMATVTCPVCCHTGKAAVPRPAMSSRAGVRQVKSIWPDGETPPAAWRSPRHEVAWAEVEG